MGVGVCLFDFFLIDREEVEVNKSVKKGLKTIFRHLEQTSLASNGLIIQWNPVNTTTVGP